MALLQTDHNDKVTKWLLCRYKKLMLCHTAQSFGWRKLADLVIDYQSADVLSASILCYLDFLLCKILKCFLPNVFWVSICHSFVLYGIKTETYLAFCPFDRAC